MVWGVNGIVPGGSSLIFSPVEVGWGGGGVKAGQLEVEVELYLWAAAGALPPLALH